MDESGGNGPEQDPPQEQDQRGKADQVVDERIGIRQELGKRAQEAHDPSSSEPDERGAPAREQ